MTRHVNKEDLSKLGRLCAMANLECAGPLLHPSASLLALAEKDDLQISERVAS